MARENGVHKIEVHVAGLCFDLEPEDGPRCLIAKRAADRKLYPDLWECGGGQMRTGETFPHALERQMREEFGIEVEVLFAFGDYFIPTENGGIPGMKFVCLADSQQEVTLDPQEHTDYAWVALDSLADYAFIPGVADEIAESFNILAEC